MEPNIEQEKKPLTYLGKITLHRGHSLFKMDRETGEVTKVGDDDYLEMGEEVVGENLSPVPGRRRLRAEPQCLYTSALNTKNAIKRFNRLLAYEQVQHTPTPPQEE